METKLTKVSGFSVKIDKNANDAFVIEYWKADNTIVQLYMATNDISARFFNNGSWVFKPIASIY